MIYKYAVAITGYVMGLLTVNGVLLDTGGQLKMIRKCSMNILVNDLTDEAIIQLAELLCNKRQA